ncbi:hypothetical protein [Clostridium sp.]|uniref:hypothetical protein n=1 Tax=Clostridium sp. TaxID=1506 RepID=UPI002FDEA5E1
MKRTGNNIDDLMQLALYMIPKYMKRIDRYNRRHYKDLGHDKEYYEEQYMDNKELIKFIEKNILKEEGILTGKKDRDKSIKTKNEKSEDILESGIIKKVKDKVEKKLDDFDKKESDSVDIGKKKEIQDKKISEDSDKKEEESKTQISKANGKVNNDEKQKADTDKADEDKVSDENEAIGKEEKKQVIKPKKSYNVLSRSKVCVACNRSISNLMNKLIGEKLDLCVKEDKMSILNEVSLIYSDEVLIKLTNELEEKIIIPIKNVVGLQSNKISSLDKSLKEVSKDQCCKFEKSMENYFNDLVGKKVIIQTSGQGKFAYIYNKTVVEVGVGFVVIEDNMIVTFSSIVLIRELKGNDIVKLSGDS